MTPTELVHYHSSHKSIQQTQPRETSTNVHNSDGTAPKQMLGVEKAYSLFKHANICWTLFANMSTLSLEDQHKFALVKKHYKRIFNPSVSKT